MRSGRSPKKEAFSDLEFYIRDLLSKLNQKIYTGLEKMIANPSRAKMVIIREMPIPYSDSTSKNTLKKFISIIKI
jgi:hypothetical protein